MFSKQIIPHLILTIWSGLFCEAWKTTAQGNKAFCVSFCLESKGFWKLDYYKSTVPKRASNVNTMLDMKYKAQQQREFLDDAV